MDNKIPKIEGKVLEESDIGKLVWYVPNHAQEGDFTQWEQGIISSFECRKGEAVIFIRYRSSVGERTPSENLRWVKRKEK